MPLTDYVTYADAHKHCSKQALWDLFDGDREQLNLTHECIDRHVGKGRAVRIAFADGREEAYTFDELARWSNRFANYLEKSGIRKGDRVAIMLEPGLPYYVALFGAMKRGAVAVPMFTLFGKDALAARLDDCTPRLLVTTEEKELLAAGREGLEVIVGDDTFLERLKSESASYTASTSSNDMAMYQYTSGTTRALPEAVQHRHRAVVTVMIAALYATGVRPGDLYCCPSSPAWGHGLWHGTLGPLALGVEITAWSGPFDPDRFAQVLADYEITNLSAAATHYRMIKNANAAAGHRFKLEKLTFTGEPIDSDTAQFVARTFGSEVRSIYGTTEVGVILAGYPGATDLPVKPGSLGKPMPGVELAVHDPLGQPCAPGQMGEIVLRRRDGWFPTKDLGSIDEDGYFFHGGRADDVIISAGWTLSAVEIEDTLLKHPAVDEIAVIGVPDDVRGQVVKAFVVSARDASAQDGSLELETELQDFARERLGQHEYPRVVVFVNELPKTPAGKVNRKVLREQERVKGET
ncbi:MAG TPA: acyl-CoA synthetase [Sneathiellales bacterium]|nr:acyl-CoA synthetase [Sneathiellales bacterium]